MKKKTHDVVRPYEVDGIKEYDNPMPQWWLALFYCCIAFAILYMAIVHGWQKTSIEKELAEDKASLKKLTLASQPGSTGEGSNKENGNLAALLMDPQNAAKGKELFTTTCSPCHGPSGEGVVGPNLSDAFWLHGGKPEQILATITEGVPEKGMPAWGPVLGPKKVLEVAAFVVTLKNTNVPNGKAPEGTEE